MHGANTPLSPDERAALIPDLIERRDLNEWERDNIFKARRWALSRRQLTRMDPATETYIRKLHLEMFNQTWKWAGHYRQSPRDLGVPVHEIHESIGRLLGDVRYWLEHRTYDLAECAVRFHHRLVVIHPFPNGNGRHARLIADVVAAKNGLAVFSWGNRDIVPEGKSRHAYLRALKAADNGDIRPLVNFALS